MKRMFTRIGNFGLPRCHPTLLWCVVAAAFLLGEPGVGRAQTSEAAKATEQLFDAVHANDFATVQASVAAGADVDASDRWGMSPMELAIDKGYFEIGHYLVAVRNFNRASADDRPAAPAPAGSPFGSVSSDEVAARPPGSASPLGPLSGPANTGGSGRDASGDLDLETSAGGQTGPTGKANPFDPSAPAHGTRAFSVGEIGGDTAGSKAPAEPAADGTAPSEFSNRVVGVGGESQ